jgi:hypothetical protein
VLELNADKTIAKEDAVINKLTSFQGTSIRASNGQVYITTGDGAKGTQGGLYIYDAIGNTLINFVKGKDHARSVDVDESDIYLMQAEGARITRYDLNGDNPALIYDVPGEATQAEAKSELLVWKDYLLVAENESGLRMLNKVTGEVVDQLDRPGEDENNHVTNSIAINDSKKKDADGKEISSNLLLLANGTKGIYWYDIMKVDDKDQIVLCSGNSIIPGDGGYSANFIASTGNLVFLADGLGGLKVLYIGFAAGSTPPIVDKHACDDFIPFLFDIDNVQGLLPESHSVFRNTADPIVKTLFATETASSISDYIEILEDTELHISFMWEGAGWVNALGFFVIPAEFSTLSGYDYYNAHVKNELCTTEGSVNVLKKDYTIFQKINMGSGYGDLVPNTTFKIENYNSSDKKFKKGDRVVLFMVPNGWNAQSAKVNVKFDNKDSSHPQIFFMDKEINRQTNVPFGAGYPAAYKGILHNLFYSTSCHNLVMIIEDTAGASDLDYNDIVFTISDGTDLTSNLEQPRFKVGLDGAGGLVITE